jgi:hypothetical protein
MLLAARRFVFFDLSLEAWRRNFSLRLRFRRGVKGCIAKIDNRKKSASLNKNIFDIIGVIVVIVVVLKVLHLF